MNARVFVTWLILASTHVMAAEADNWAAGRDAFERGDYASALTYFESARAGGLGGPAVHYNIAVCHFRLGDFEAAGMEFGLLADHFPDMRGLAEYNLGLVARRLGDDEAAARHFLAAYELSADNRTIRVLASRQLGDTVGDIELASTWSGAIGLNLGYDDNVALRDETGLPATVTTESPTAEFFASVQGPWTGRSGFRVSGDLYIVRNFDADEFDQMEIRAGAVYDVVADAWRLRAGTHVTTGTLGGDGFDRKVGVNATATRDIGDRASFGAMFVYDDVSETDADFAGIAGTRQQLQAWYRWAADGHRVVLRLRQESNDRVDPGVSPARLGLGIEYRYRRRDGWGYEAGLGFRTSDYDELATPRTEDQTVARVGISRYFGSDWLALLEYRYYDNDSTDPDYAYDRNRLTLGAMWLF